MRCRVCKRPALFRSKGKKANRRLHGDKQHDLCQRCHRDLQNAELSARRKGRTTPRPPDRADVGTDEPVIGPFLPLHVLLAQASLSHRYDSITWGVREGFVELGVEGGSILWDVRQPAAPRRSPQSNAAPPGEAP